MIIIGVVILKPHKRPDILQSTKGLVKESNVTMLSKDVLNQTERFNIEQRAKFEEMTKDYVRPIISIKESKSQHTLKPKPKPSRNITSKYINPTIYNPESNHKFDSTPTLPPNSKETINHNSLKRKNNSNI